MIANAKNLHTITTTSQARGVLLLCWLAWREVLTSVEGERERQTDTDRRDSERE
jgi:hypothetical protein